MKILEINAYYNYGSTGHIVKDLFEEGKRNGYEMYAIYWLRRKASEENANVVYCGEDKNPSIITNAAYWTIAGGGLNYNTERTKRIINQINIIKPDIIHLHNLHGDFEYGSIDTELFFNSLAEYGCKILWTFHDCWPITGRCYYFEYKECTNWKFGCGKCPQRLFDRQGVLSDKSATNLRVKSELYEKIHDLKIITVSHWLEDTVKKSILKNRDVTTIYNGINTDVFKVDENIQEHDGILCIGWDRRKGFTDYIKLAELMPEKKIYVLGQRPFFRKYLRLPRNVKEIGFTSNVQEMASLYNRMAVYFNASVAETFGLTTAEAIACGLPVVGYATTATPEIVKDGCGHCVKRNDVEKAVKAIEKMVSSDNQEKRHIRSNMARISFTKEIMMSKYMREYKGKKE